METTKGGPSPVNRDEEIDYYKKLSEERELIISDLSRRIKEAEEHSTNGYKSVKNTKQTLYNSIQDNRYGSASTKTQDYTDLDDLFPYDFKSAAQDTEK